MAVGIKAQTVGKALFIEVQRHGDNVNQLIVVPNLPNEYGKKSGATTIYKRNFSPSYSRNSWDYGTKISVSLGADSLDSLDSQHEEVELDHYGAPRIRNRWYAESKKVTLKNLDELTEETEKAEAHANMVLLTTFDSLVNSDNEWSEELLQFTKVDYKLVDESPLMVPIEITDKDMTDIMAENKLPQAVIRRLMNARKRPI